MQHRVCDDPLRGPLGPWHKVVGVVEDVTARGVGIGAAPEPTIYVSALQHPPRRIDVFMRIASELPEASDLAAALAGPVTDIGDVATLADRLERFAAPLDWFARLLLAAAVITLLLTTSGVASLSAQQVAFRRTEIGTRLALGATPHAVIRLVLRDAAHTTMVGAVLGLPLAAGVAGLLRLGFPGIRLLDPALYAAVAGALLLVTVVAGWSSASKAARSDPAVMLRGR